MAEKLDILIERVRKEGQLTRNSGAHSIKSIKEIISPALQNLVQNTELTYQSLNDSNELTREQILAARQAALVERDRASEAKKPKGEGIGKAAAGIGKGVGDAATGEEVTAAVCPRSADSNHSQIPVSFTVLDSPATTSATTYKVQISRGPDATGTVHLNSSPDGDANNGNTASTITVMEVSA